MCPSGTEKMSLMELKDVTTQCLVRVHDDFDKARKEAENLFGPVEIIQLDKSEKEFAFITPEESEGTLQEKIFTLKEKDAITDIGSYIRIER